MVIVDLVDGGEDGGNAGHGAAVVEDGFDGLVDGQAGGDRRHQQQHMLAADHGLEVVTEDHLAVGVVLRGNHIDGLVAVDAHKAGAGEFLGQIGAHNLGAVQADDGIHDGGGHILLHQIFRHGHGLALTGFQGGDVDVVVDVGVVGGEMSGNDLEGDAVGALGAQLDHAIFHKQFLHCQRRFAACELQNAFFLK